MTAETESVLFKGLNENQKEAVLETEGFVRVIAGPGSGKTKVLTSRYAHIVKNLGVLPDNILCVTFTNKAAFEIRKRIKNLVAEGDFKYISTFHGFCVNVLREDIHVLNFPKNFMILDETDSKKVLKNVYETCNLKLKDLSYKKAIGMIENAKRSSEYVNLITDLNDDTLKKAYDNETNIINRVFLGYLFEQKKVFGLDFNDLINFTLKIFKERKDVLEKWQKRLQYIMVDEFQDVSRKQYLLCKLLCAYHKNLFAVGDPDQTIYSWRGANPDIIINFDKDFEDTKTCYLNINYRSTSNILNVANSLISNNKNRLEKVLTPVKKEKKNVVYNHFKDDKGEAEWIANQIKLLKQSGLNLNDIAILYRSHYVSRKIEEGLMKFDIPYVIYSGINFYERKEIKDIISYLRVICYRDDISFERVINEPKRNFGAKRLEILKDYVSKNGGTLYDALVENKNHPLIQKSLAKDFINLIEKYSKTFDKMPLGDLIENILTESGYNEMLQKEGDDERLDNIAELKQSIFDLEQTDEEKITLEEYLQKIALLANTDKNDKKDTVKLMTIHSAKGLEFPCVFVCGLSEGVLPSKNTGTLRELEEERRLAFVAFTRAENLLILTDAEGFNYDNTFRFPSRFIFNIKKELLEFKTELSKTLIEEALCYIKNHEEALVEKTEPADKGARIRHKFLGEGTIVAINKEAETYTINFDKTKTERTLKFGAPIEII